MHRFRRHGQHDPLVLPKVDAFYRLCIDLYGFFFLYRGETFCAAVDVFLQGDALAGHTEYTALLVDCFVGARILAERKSLVI